MVRRAQESMPVEALLEGYPRPLLDIAERLRELVMAAAPDATERVRSGWKLIGYDLPIRRNGVFFGWIWPEGVHVHLGFPNGDLMEDPTGALDGASIAKRARWLTYEAGSVIDEPLATSLVLEAVRVAMVPRSLFVRGGDVQPAEGSPRRGN
jgi:hypothetical protein